MATTKILYDTFGTKSGAETCVRALKTIWACGSRLSSQPNASAAEIVEAGPRMYEVYLTISE